MVSLGADFAGRIGFWWVERLVAVASIGVGLVLDFVGFSGVGSGLLIS